ncbi:FtsB family cell division protein [Nocardioides acrostichi]|uniref:Septum formation initiator family protein n=1 Tax=Nocardioides acrostichi TaxID=2784339 RepID=A0A930V327_9ACTN|nr:septum formation initiator family protein [Nocardioides acrostichi]MBF4162902.1 septum formation initiator family protein [Nocardioides acrostichi]
MPDRSRTPSRGSGPRGRTGPGRSAGREMGREGARENVRRPDVAGWRGRLPERLQAVRRPKPTRRAVILVLVLLVLAVSYASSARAYLQQRAELDQLRTEIAQRQASIDELEGETDRWKDPAYVAQQARELGYVMPGETSYVVLDQNGEPMETQHRLAAPGTVAPEQKQPFFDDAWDSVLLAGNPPKNSGTPPASHIDGQSDDRSDDQSDDQ